MVDGNNCRSEDLMFFLKTRAPFKGWLFAEETHLFSLLVRLWAWEIWDHLWGYQAGPACRGFSTLISEGLRSILEHWNIISLLKMGSFSTMPDVNFEATSVDKDTFHESIVPQNEQRWLHGCTTAGTPGFWIVLGACFWLCWLLGGRLLQFKSCWKQQRNFQTVGIDDIMLRGKVFRETLGHLRVRLNWTWLWGGDRRYLLRQEAAAAWSWFSDLHWSAWR